MKSFSTRHRRPLRSLLLLASLLNSPNYPACQADQGAQDLLAEILAEEAQNDEEHARLEAESREYEAAMASSRETKPKGMPSSSTYSTLEAELQRQREASRRASGDDEASERAERIRLRREAAFESELEKMNERERIEAGWRKRRDSKIVSGILRASKRGRHYAVLGIRNLEFQVGPFRIFGRLVGPWVLFRIGTKDIKRIYRNLARTVHPDKNRDGRAEEAFLAMENSAEILTDEKKRGDYDRRLIAGRRRRNKELLSKVLEIGGDCIVRGLGAVRLGKRMLGPFSTPILVVGALII